LSNHAVSLLSVSGLTITPDFSVPTKPKNGHG